jgi:hypothetical protein
MNDGWMLVATLTVPLLLLAAWLVFERRTAPDDCLLCARPLPRQRWWELMRAPMCRGDAEAECRRLLAARMGVKPTP